MPKRGRPLQTEREAAEEAARVIEVACALRYYPAQLLGMGFVSEHEARQYVSKRYRGGVGGYVGDSVRALLYPAENRVQLAVSLVLDHGLTSYRAAKNAKVDPKNLKRALDAGRGERSAAAERQSAMRTQITDAA